jgi:hypothetical protein
MSYPKAREEEKEANSDSPASSKGSRCAGCGGSMPLSEAEPFPERDLCSLCVEMTDKDDKRNG